MNKIKMGADEFMLHARKNKYASETPNNIISKVVWQKIQKLDPSAIKVEEDQECFWGFETDNTDDKGLPKTADQFEFDKQILPAVFSYIESL